MSSDEELKHYATVLERYKHLSTLKFLRSDGELKKAAVGDGNLNDVIRIGKGNSNVILKIAPPYIKCLGPDFPLDPIRGQTEYHALCIFADVAPGSVPTPFFYDKESYTIGMEDLKSYDVFRRKLISGECCNDVVEKLARNIGRVHHLTHKATLGEKKFQDLKEKFKDSELVSLTDQFVFTRPFDRNDSTNRFPDGIKSHMDQIYENPAVLQAAKDMKKIFLERKECLSHGDLHTGSLMVDKTDVKMIDLEFVYVGPPSFDIGMLIANYIFSYYGHMSTEEDNDKHRNFAYSMVDACKLTVKAYFENMTTYIGDKESYQDQLVSEMAGFAGCELIRRIVGAAPVADLHNDFSKQDALGAGVRLLLAKDRIHTIDRLLVIALMLT